MGNSVLRRYRTQPEANHDGWRKPKAKSAAKDKAAPAPDANQVAQTWLRAGVKSVNTTNAPGAPPGKGSSAVHSSTAPSQDDDDDLAGFSNLADAANKVWDDLMSRQTSVKGKQEMNALFGLSELKDAVERSVKRVEVLQRQVDTLSSRLHQHESSLDDLRRKFEASPAPSTGQWKLGDMAIRRGKGFCELSMVQLDVQPPFFEVRMSTTGSIVGTEAEKLLPLSLQQQNAAKATLKDHEQAKQALSTAEETLLQAQEELRQQHQSLTEQVETKLKEPLAPKGLPDFSYLSKAEAGNAKVPEPSAYPEVKGVKEDMRSRSKAREETRDSRPDAAPSVNSTASTTLPRHGPSGPAGFPSFEDLSRMQKEAEKQKVDASKPSSYPAPHATREVFNRPEANLDKSYGPTAAADVKESTTKSTMRETPFVPAGMPGIPTAGGASGAASKASLSQQRAQQEAFLHQQEAQLQREEAQRQQQQEAQRQREEAERQKQEEWQKQSAKHEHREQRKEPAAQAPPQPQTEWVRYKTPDGQVYYHNENTNHTAWSLPPGATAREPTAAGASTGQQGTNQSQEDPFADLRKQEEDNKKQREEWQQWYQQYTTWYSQQAGAGAKNDTSGAQQQQQQQQQTYVPPKGPAPPKLDAKFEDHALYQIKSSVLKEMESMVNEGMEVAKRKKALRFLQLRWHPDKNPDKLEIANSIFQFIEETKPWFLHDPNAEGS